MQQTKAAIWITTILIVAGCQSGIPVSSENNSREILLSRDLGGAEYSTINLSCWGQTTEHVPVHELHIVFQNISNRIVNSEFPINMTSGVFSRVYQNGREIQKTPFGNLKETDFFDLHAGRIHGSQFFPMKLRPFERYQVEYNLDDIYGLDQNKCYQVTVYAEAIMDNRAVLLGATTSIGTAPKNRLKGT